MIPKKVYISVVVWDEGRKYDFLEVREKPYQTTDTQCHWREYTDLSSLWHDASEEPKIDEDVVLYDSCGNFVTEFYNGDVTWNNIVVFHKATIWAYISDLLPKGGNE